jgi:hypothetical protein
MRKADIRAGESLSEHLARNLQDAVKRLQADIEGLEICIGALAALARPVPPIEPAADAFLLPRSCGGGASSSRRHPPR